MPFCYCLNVGRAKMSHNILPHCIWAETMANGCQHNLQLLAAVASARNRTFMRYSYMI